MEPHVDTQHSPRILSLRALLSVSLILLLSLSLGGTLEYLRSSEQARHQANDVGLMFGRSSAVLIQPLVLADDRISLNFLFNELAAQPLISGLRLTAPDQTLIALAGQPQGRGHSLELVQGDDVIGQLTYWTDPAPFEQLLHRQLIEIALLLGGSLLLTAILIGFSLRRQPEPAPPKPDFREFARELTPEVTGDTIPAFSFDELDSEPEPAPITAVRHAPSVEQGSSVGLNISTDSDNSLETAETLDHAPGPEPEPEPKPEAEPEQQEDKAESAVPPALHGRREPSFDTDELVSLLKPERDSARMPSFSPHAPQITEPEDDSDEALVPYTEEMELEERTAEEDEYTPLRPNPLKLGDEEQLGLYSFEHELELMLTPDEAGYLLLIDTRSAHSDNVDEEERSALLKNYRTLANSVARIYSGNIETLSDGNLRVLFTNADDKDSHGVNALCCAMLFTHLYQQYNQSQIRAFKPVMNLHMALVRGARERVERMQEEAHFLTRTTQSNELISHTALTEAPLLKESLLQKADIRREEEDKVLILSVSEAYQALLEKQARHLLSKLNERQQSLQSGQPAS